MERRDVVRVIVAGVLLGACARAVDLAFPRWVGDMAAIWVLVPFLVGRRSDNRRKASVQGAVCLVLASLTYYAWRASIDGSISSEYLLSVGVLWTLLAVVTGAVSGGAGWSSEGSPRWWGLVTGAFVGEAVAVLILRERALQVGLEFVTGLAFLLAARRELLKAVAVAAAASLVLGLVAGGFRLGREARRSRAAAIFRAEGLAPHAT